MQSMFVEQLMRMLDNIALNAGYPRYLENQSVLIDHQIYFDICQIIFPELNIKLIKILQYKGLNPPQKLQYLIDLLSQEFRVDLSDIKGREIMTYNLEHIHKFLDLLLQYSKMYMESVNPGKKKVNSDPARDNSEEFAHHSKSERRNPKAKNNDEDQSKQDSDTDHIIRQEEHPPQEGQYLMKEVRKKKKKPQYSSLKKRARSQREQRRNLHESVVKIVMNQKNHALKASIRENRKNNNQDVFQAKKYYKTYLDNYRKDNVVRRRREKRLASKSESGRLRSASELPVKDFGDIENFFDSFALKFRDQKSAYLRKIKNLVEKQEKDRYAYKNKLERDVKKQLENKLRIDIDSEKHQHQLKKNLLKEKSQIVSSSIQLMKKEYHKKANQQLKQLRESKKKEMTKIQNYLKQENQKVLMTLEEGGSLERVIMSLYKRF